MKRHNKTYCTGSLANLHDYESNYTNKQRNLAHNATHQQSGFAKATKGQSSAPSNSYLDVFDDNSHSVLSSQNTKKKGYQTFNQFSSREQVHESDKSLRQQAFLKRKNKHQFQQVHETPSRKKNRNQTDAFTMKQIKQFIYQSLLENYQYENAQVVQQLKNIVSLQEAIKIGMQMAVKSKFRYFQSSKPIKQTKKYGDAGNRRADPLFQSFGGNQNLKFRKTGKFQTQLVPHTNTTRGDEGSSTDYYSCRFSQFQDSMLSEEDRIRSIKSCKNPDVHYELLNKIAEKNCQLEEKEQLLFQLKQRVQQVENQKLKYKLKIQKMQGYLDSYQTKIEELHNRINQIERGNSQGLRSPYQSDMDVSYDDFQSNGYQSRIQKHKSHANIFSQRNQKSHLRMQPDYQANRYDQMRDVQASPVNSARTLNQLSLKLQMLQKRVEMSRVNTPTHSTFSKGTKNKTYSTSYQNSPIGKSPRSQVQISPVYKEKILQLKSQIESLEAVHQLNQLKENQSILLDKLKEKDQMIDKLMAIKTDSIQNQNYNSNQQYEADSFAVPSNHRQKRVSRK